MARKPSITSSIRCVVVVTSPEDIASAAQATRPRFRPSDLLPWADPHIRSLVEQLQDEVRDEQAARRLAPRPTSSDLDRWASTPTAAAPQREAELAGCC